MSVDAHAPTHGHRTGGTSPMPGRTAQRSLAEPGFDDEGDS